MEDLVAEKDALLQKKIKTIGNYVHDSVPVSNDEVRQGTLPIKPSLPLCSTNLLDRKITLFYGSGRLTELRLKSGTASPIMKS